MSAQCSVSATAVAFGNYNVFATGNVDSTATVTVNCTLLGTVSVQLNRGQFATSFSPRQMNRSGERLNYNLFFDSTRTQIWGDGTSGTVVWSAGLVSGNQSRTVYGRLFPLQNVTVGAYTDTVIVTAVF
ncbi:MAG: spore coat U domain-containing protein [Acidobacteria bacterium]|nr:spore coat U domain-containing protein [Acidobacteriota bacterium]